MPLSSTISFLFLESSKKSSNKQIESFSTYHKQSNLETNSLFSLQSLYSILELKTEAVTSTNSTSEIQQAVYQSYLRTMFIYRCPRCLQRLARPAYGSRFQSTTSDAVSSPLMSRIRNDLKTAMRAKDTTRLNVLRSIISETNNASKGPSPIKTDLQLLALLRKKAAQSRDASKQFAEAKREDLQAKEDAQANVVDEYIGQVETMPEEDVNRIVQETVDKLKATTQNLRAGQVLQKLFESGGVLDGKPVEKGSVAQMVARALR